MSYNKNCAFICVSIIFGSKNLLCFITRKSQPTGSDLISCEQPHCKLPKFATSIPPKKTSSAQPETIKSKPNVKFKPMLA